MALPPETRGLFHKHFPYRLFAITYTENRVPGFLCNFPMTFNSNDFRPNIADPQSPKSIRQDFPFFGLLPHSIFHTSPAKYYFLPSKYSLCSLSQSLHSL